MYTNRIKTQSKFIISILIATTFALGGCQSATQDTTERSVIEVDEAAPVVPEPTEAPPPTPTSPPPTATKEPSPTPIPPTDTPAPTPTNAITIIEGELTIYTEDEGLFSNNIFQVFADSSGRIWVVSGPWMRSDISVFDGYTWISHTDDLPSSGWFHVNEAPDGSIWVALPGAGHKIAHLDEESWSVLQMDMAGNFETFDIAISKAQTVWVLDADHGKLKCYEEGEWVDYDITVPSSSRGYPGCHSINLATDGSVWVSCGNLFHFNQKSQSYESIQPEAAGNIIASAFTIDSAGMFWIGTDKGFATYDGNTWTYYDESDGLDGTRVLSLAFAGDGKAFFGTNVGVSGFDGKSWYSIDIPKEYIGSGIRTITIATDGSLWFGNSRGLFHFVPEG